MTNVTQQVSIQSSLLLNHISQPKHSGWEEADEISCVVSEGSGPAVSLENETPVMEEPAHSAGFWVKSLGPSL